MVFFVLARVLLDITSLNALLQCPAKGYCECVTTFCVSHRTRWARAPRCPPFHRGMCAGRGWHGGSMLDANIPVAL